MSEEIVYPKGTEFEHKAFQDFLKSVGVKFSVESWCSLPRKFGRYWPDEVQREWNRRAQPAEQMGGPYRQHKGIVGYARKSDLEPLLDETQPDGSHIYLGLDHPVCWADEPPYEHLTPLYLRPVEQSVKLPERMKKTAQSSDEYDMCADAHNACLDAVAKLNGIEP